MTRNNVFPKDPGHDGRKMFTSPKRPLNDHAKLLVDANRKTERPKATKDNASRRSAPGLKRGTSNRV